MSRKFLYGFSMWVAAPLILATPALLAQDFSQPDSKPSPDAPLVQKANDALARGQYQQALQILTELKAKNPADAQVLYDMGLTVEALQSEPPKSSAIDGTSSNTPTAESCYKQAITADPDFAAPHVALGLLLARKGDTTEAHAEFSKAIALKEIQPELKARSLRALARLDLESDPSSASSELLDALKLSPQQPSDILLSAQIADASKDYSSAEQSYRRYLATPEGTGNLQGTSGLAHVLLELHRDAEAKQTLQQALAKYPGNPALVAQLAQVDLSSGDPSQAAQAVPLLEKLHAAHPEDASITRLLAETYTETGSPSKAEPLYAQMLAASSKPDPMLVSDRADALIRMHRPAEAAKLLKQVLPDRNGFPTAQAYGNAALQLAFAASEIDDPKTTLQALTMRATVLPPSPSSLFLEATANDALHQSSQAVELYQKFLTSAAGSYPEQEAQARKRLIELQNAK